LPILQITADQFSEIRGSRDSLIGNWRVSESIESNNQSRSIILILEKFAWVFATFHQISSISCLCHCWSIEEYSQTCIYREIWIWWSRYYDGPTWHQTTSRSL